MISQVPYIGCEMATKSGSYYTQNTFNFIKKNAEEKQICVALAVARRKRQFVGQHVKKSRD